MKRLDTAFLVRMIAPPSCAVLLCAVLAACGGDDTDGRGGGDDTDAPSSPDAGAPPDPGPSPDASPAAQEYPDIVDYEAIVSNRYACEVGGGDVCCADYQVAFRIDNVTDFDIARVTNVRLTLDGMVVDTGSINCFDSPWQLSSGAASSEAIELTFTYRNDEGVPALSYPCGAETIDATIDPSLLPAGDAPVAGAASLSIDGTRANGTWNTFVYAQLLDLSASCP